METNSVLTMSFNRSIVIAMYPSIIWIKSPLAVPPILANYHTINVTINFAFPVNTGWADESCQGMTLILKALQNVPPLRVYC